MFDARDENKEDSNTHHVAEMVALLGPPPREFLQRSEFALEFFDEHGKSINLGAFIYIICSFTGYS